MKLFTLLGYTVCNDVSARKWQTQLCGGQWCFGKGFDTFNPLGPMIVSSKLIKDPNNLTLGTKVNGQVLQHYNTSDMSEYIYIYHVITAAGL